MSSQIEVQSPSIFLSYAKEDKRKVSQIYKRLLTEGLRPWLDTKDILPGQDWDRVIVDAIRSARFVLVFLSNNSVNKRGYVQTEIREALDAADRLPDGQVFIIPVKLEQCVVPERLRKWQWIDASRPNSISKIVAVIRSHLGIELDTNARKKRLANSEESVGAALDSLLLAKFRERGSFLYGRMKSGLMAMSDSAFLEFRKRVPTSFMHLRTELGDSRILTDATVARSITEPSVYRKRKYEVHQFKFLEPFRWAYVLITEADVRCAVDREYFNYILARYPRSEIYVRGKELPVIVETNNVPCCVVMPMSFTEDQLR